MNGLYQASEYRQCKGWTVVDTVTSCPDTSFGTKVFIAPAGRSVSYWWLMANPSWRISLRWKELLLQRLCSIQRGSPYPMTGQGGDTKTQSFYFNLGQFCRTIPAPKLLRDVQMPFLQFHPSSPSTAHSCFSSSSQFLFLQYTSYVQISFLENMV